MKVWLKLYLVVLFIISVLEALMPEGKTEKYIKAATSLMFVVLVFMPITKTLIDYDFAFYFNELSIGFDEFSFEIQSQAASNNYKNIMLKTYVSSLQNALERALIQNKMNSVRNIVIIVDENSNTDFYLSIKSVTVTLDEQNRYDNEKVERIIFFIADFYKLPKENIYVIYEPN